MIVKDEKPDSNTSYWDYNKQLKKKAKELPSFKLSAADFIMEQVMGEEFETDDDMRDIEADDIKSEDSSISDSNELAQQ